MHRVPNAWRDSNRSNIPAGVKTMPSTVSLASSLTKMLIFSSRKLWDKSLKKTEQRER